MRRLLVAGRGATAVRTIDTCRRLGLSPIAVAAASDPQQLHVLRAVACVYLEGSGMAETYDSVDSIVAAALRCDAHAVHPGCGALAENPTLPERLAALGIGYVGPTAAGLARASDKGIAVAAAESLGIPVLPHATGRDGIARLVAEVGLPVILKPVGGCLGEGVRVALTATDVERALAAQDEPNWYAERYVHPGRVVAVTVAVDTAGTVVELGERETLLLAGSLKLLDATPILSLPPDLVARMRRDAARLVADLGLHNVASVEFIVGAEGYFLLEVNGRLTGAYRMCEAQTGVDVLALQLEIEDGRMLSRAEMLVDRSVHCMEARLYLRRDTSGAGGRSSHLGRLYLARESGVTYNCGIDQSRPLVMDNMIAQVLATGESREAAARRVLRALKGSEVSGIAHYGEEIAEWVGASLGKGHASRCFVSEVDTRSLFSAVAYSVDRQLAAAIAGSRWQDEQPTWYQRFKAEVQSYAQRHLTARPGYFVLSGMEHLTEPEARRFTLATSRMLGELMPQDFVGEMMREVKDRGVRLEEAATARYSDTRQGGKLHTDGIHRPGRVPDFFSLYCYRQARQGGSLVLVHIEDVLEILRAHRPDVLETLRRPVHFDTRVDGTTGAPRTVRRPVVEVENGVERVHYLREYIESGHRHDGVEPLSADQLEALDVLDSLLDRPDLQTHGRLQAGEMIFINNRSIIHGRTAFEEDATHNRRLLFRAWIAGSISLLGTPLIRSSGRTAAGQ